MNIYFDLPTAVATPFVNRIFLGIIFALLIINGWILVSYILPSTNTAEAPITPPQVAVAIPTPPTPETPPPAPATTTPIIATTTKSTTATPVAAPKKPTTTAPTTPKPTTTPKPVVATTLACGKGGSCTKSDIAKHSTRADCWVYLSPINKAYNITEYVADGEMHPGGDVIVPYCGQNIYNYFIGTAGGHAHGNSALNKILQSYYVGPFAS